jgi:hypothetical protein
MFEVGNAASSGVLSINLAVWSPDAYKRKLRMKVLIAGLALALSAHASGADGNYIAKLASAHDRVTQGRGSMADALDAGRLDGFVIAVADQSSLMGLICTPDQVTYEQLVAVTKKALREQPDRWHWDGHLVVQLALADAFPCKK